MFWHLFLAFGREMRVFSAGEIGKTVVEMARVVKGTPPKNKRRVCSMEWRGFI